VSAVLKLTSLATLVVALCFGAGYLLDRTHKLAGLPPGMNLQNVLYADEGRRTAIIVYEMPDDFAAGLEEGGLAYLKGFAVVPGDGSPHMYSDWRRTPVSEDEGWSYPTGLIAEGVERDRPSVRDYTDRYDISTMDRHIEQMVDEALNTPGSYYDCSSSGKDTLIVAIPQSRKIVYAASDG